MSEKTKREAETAAWEIWRDGKPYDVTRRRIIADRAMECGDELKPLFYGCTRPASPCPRCGELKAGLDLEVELKDRYAGELRLCEDRIAALEAENAAQLAELHAISEALGTSEGHSSLVHIAHLHLTITAQSAALAVAKEAMLREQQFGSCAFTVDKRNEALAAIDALPKAPDAWLPITDDKIDAVLKALRKAWNLGQTYWQQADSEYISQNKKSDETFAKMNQLVDDTRRVLLAPPAPEGEV